MTLGQKIKRLRGWMPQAELARQVGVGRQAVCEWEKDAARPSIEKLPALAKALGVTIDDLLTSPDQPAPTPQQPDPGAHKTANGSAA